LGVRGHGGPSEGGTGARRAMKQEMSSRNQITILSIIQKM
jgi:hypothetical protein